MAISSETEYPPLLPAGFHALSIPDVRELCVGKFPDSQTRSQIMAGLEDIVAVLQKYLIEAEIWLDGSFLTTKIDPIDSDVVVRLTSTFADTVSPEQFGVLNWINSNLKGSHACDSYVFCEYPTGQGEWMRAYWIKQFGFSRGEGMKGIALIKTP
jgi:hypothetical protein